MHLSQIKFKIKCLIILNNNTHNNNVQFLNVTNRNGGTSIARAPTFATRPQARVTKLKTKYRYAVSL